MLLADLAYKNIEINPQILKEVTRDGNLYGRNQSTRDTKYVGCNRKLNKYISLISLKDICKSVIVMLYY